MKILTATLIIEENDGEEYDVKTYSNIISEAIGNNTTASVLDGNVFMSDIKK